MTNNDNTTAALRIAIVGGGAAGFFAAIEAKRRQPSARVCLYEKNAKVLAKVAVTGGGRCNLTNSFAEVSDLRQVYPRGHQLMKRLFNQFDHHATMAWFERHGVALVTQDDQCVFPQSQDAQTIIDSLVSQAKALGVTIHTRHSLVAIARGEDDRLLLSFRVAEGGTSAEQGSLRELLFDRVAITTGGHPRADRFDYLARLGHEVEAPVPSLFTLNIADPAFRALMGTVVERALVSIPSTKHKAAGPLLITHWGMSGPAVLKLSSHAARHLRENDYRDRVAVNWVDETNQALVGDTIRRLASANPQKQLTSLRPYGLPARLWGYLLAKIGLAQDKKWAEIGKKGHHQLVSTLTNDLYEVNGKGSFKDEFVTCGGIALRHLHPHTLESKVCSHLFFAGEVCDVDAITGGFNLQAAWTMGHVVGRHIVD